MTCFGPETISIKMMVLPYTYGKNLKLCLVNPLLLKETGKCTGGGVAILIRRTLCSFINDSWLMPSAAIETLCITISGRPSSPHVGPIHTHASSKRMHREPIHVFMSWRPIYQIYSSLVQLDYQVARDNYTSLSTQSCRPAELFLDTTPKGPMIIGRREHGSWQTAPQRDDAQSATVTSDRDTFKRALNNIHLDGGVGPKYSLSGIERALEECLPRSYVYIFTDAPAIDYQKYEPVKRLAQKKSTQIKFVLTGTEDNCGENSRYSTFYDLADATSGQVFLVGKNNVKEIMKDVEGTVKGKTVEIIRQKFPPGYGHPLKFTVDENIAEVQIMAIGCDIKLGDVINDHNVKQDTQIKVNLLKLLVVKVLGVGPGVYTTTIGSKNYTTVVVNGESVVDFIHGFASTKPKSFRDTTIIPQSGIKSYLVFKLIKPKSEEVKLTQVKFLDLIGNVILEKSLELSDDKEQLYMSDVIDLPKNMFRLMVVGYTGNNNGTILRLGRTPIEAIPH